MNANSTHLLMVVLSFDLKQFNPEYFERLWSRVIAAGDASKERVLEPEHVKK